MTNEELVLSIQQGKNPEKCLEELFLQNLGMIAKLAIMTGGAEEKEDLQQQAYFGLIKAVERWDPQGGANFITYASYWIKAEMQRYLKSNALIAIPPNRNDIFVKIRSFDEPIPGADDLVLGDSIPDPENGVEIEQERMEREELKAVLWETVDELGENEAKVLRMRFQDDNTLKECGERMGLSIESIRRIEAKAIRRMRNYRVRRKLAPYVVARAHSISLDGGLNSFRSSGSSATERAAIFLIEQRHKQLHQG